MIWGIEPWILHSRQFSNLDLKTFFKKISWLIWEYNRIYSNDFDHWNWMHLWNWEFCCISEFIRFRLVLNLWILNGKFGFLQVLFFLEVSIIEIWCNREIEHSIHFRNWKMNWFRLPPIFECWIVNFGFYNYFFSWCTNRIKSIQTIPIMEIECVHEFKNSIHFLN